MLSPRRLAERITMASVDRRIRRLERQEELPDLERWPAETKANWIVRRLNRLTHHHAEQMAATQEAIDEFRD